VAVAADAACDCLQFAQYKTLSLPLPPSPTVHPWR